MQVVSFLCADISHLGRLNYESLSQQAQMEILVEGIENKSQLQDLNGNYLEVGRWRGVENGDVHRILWLDPEWPGAGTIDLNYLPMTVITVMIQAQRPRILIDPLRLSPTLMNLWIENANIPIFPFAKISREFKNLTIINSHIEGTVEVTDLPMNMHSFSVQENMMSGTFDFKSLPEYMAVLNIRKNFFSGSLDIENLPRRLEILNVSYNTFSGPLRFSSLPETMKEFLIEGNNFYGKIRFGRVFQSLHIFAARENKLDGEICPRELQCNNILIAKNSLSGKVKFSDFFYGVVLLDLSQNNFCGSIDLSALPGSLVEMNLSKNAFSGELKLDKLPNGLQKLNLADNRLVGIIDIGMVPISLRELNISRNRFEGKLKRGHLVVENMP